MTFLLIQLAAAAWLAGIVLAVALCRAVSVADDEGDGRRGRPSVHLFRLPE